MHSVLFCRPAQSTSAVVCLQLGGARHLILQRCSTYHICGVVAGFIVCRIGMMRPCGELSVRDGLMSCGAMVVDEAAVVERI